MVGGRTVGGPTTTSGVVGRIVGGRSVFDDRGGGGGGCWVVVGIGGCASAVQSHCHHSQTWVGRTGTRLGLIVGGSSLGGGVYGTVVTPELRIMIELVVGCVGLCVACIGVVGLGVVGGGELLGSP